MPASRGKSNGVMRIRSLSVGRHAHVKGLVWPLVGFSGQQVSNRPLQEVGSRQLST